MILPQAIITWSDYPISRSMEINPLQHRFHASRFKNFQCISKGESKLTRGEGVMTWLWPEQSHEFLYCYNLLPFLWNVSATDLKFDRRLISRLLKVRQPYHRLSQFLVCFRQKVYTSHNLDSSWLGGQSHALTLTLEKKRVRKCTGFSPQFFGSTPELACFFSTRLTARGPTLKISQQIFMVKEFKKIPYILLFFGSVLVFIFGSPLSCCPSLFLCVHQPQLEVFWLQQSKSTAF